MKTGELQAKEEQTLAEWQVGAEATTPGSRAAWGKPSWVPTGLLTCEAPRGGKSLSCVDENTGPQKGNDFPRIPAKSGLRTVPSAQAGRFKDAGRKGTQALGCCHLGLRVKLGPSDIQGGLCVIPDSQPCLVGWFSVGHWDPGEMCHRFQNSPSKLACGVGGWVLKAGTRGGRSLAGAHPQEPTHPHTGEGEGAEGAHHGRV